MSFQDLLYYFSSRGQELVRLPGRQTYREKDHDTGDVKSSRAGIIGGREPCGTRAGN